MLTPAGEAFVEAASLGLADAHGHFNGRRAHLLHAVAGDGGVGVDGGGDNAAHAGGNERIGAGRGAAGVVAGLEGHVGCAAGQAVAGVLRSHTQRDHFRVVDQVIFVPAFACYLACAVEDDAAHGRVGRGDGDAAARQLEGAMHPVTVLIWGGHAAERFSHILLEHQIDLLH